MFRLLSRAKARLLSLDRSKASPPLCIAILIVLNLAFYSKAAPTLRLVELAVCREHYLAADPSVVGRDGHVPEALCKLGSIQAKVAWLFTLDELLHFCCDFIATIPAGLLTDRYGPRPALLLNVGGFIASWAWVVAVCFFYHALPVNMVLLGPLCNLFGGASHVLQAMTFSEATHHTTDRTTMFALLEAVDPTAQFIGPIIGSSLLMIGIQVPFYFVFPVAALALPLILLLPAGPPRKTPKQDLTSENEPLIQPLPGADTDPSRQECAPGGITSYLRRGPFRELLSRVQILGSMFRCHRIVQFAVVALFVVTLGKQSLHILTQYASKRFHVPVAEAGYLLSVKAGVNLILFLVLLPAVQRWRSSRGRLVPTKVLLRSSIILLALGVALMGLAPSLAAMIPSIAVYAAGFAFPLLVRSIVVDAVEAEPESSVPLLFSGLAIAETAGSFIGATALTAIFTQTMGQTGWVSGAPFFVCSLLYILAGLSSFAVNLKPTVAQH